MNKSKVWRVLGGVGAFLLGLRSLWSFVFISLILVIMLPAFLNVFFLTFALRTTLLRIATFKISIILDLIATILSFRLSYRIFKKKKISWQSVVAPIACLVANTLIIYLVLPILL